MRLASKISLLCMFVASAVGASELAQKQKATLIVKNGTILTMDQNDSVINDGVVVVQNERILAVGGGELLERYHAEKIIDAEQGIIMPGMINAHNHVPMIAFRGLGEEGIRDRLFSYFFPLENEKLSRDLIYKATVHGAIEMALSGVTTYADMYYHIDEMARASKEVGIRAVLGETVIKYPTVVSQEPYGGMQFATDAVKKYQHDPLITPAFAPHAPYTLSKEKLQQVAALAKQYNVPLMMHVGEFDDEDKRLNLKQKSVVQYLDEIGVLSSNVLLAHAIHLSKADLDLIKIRNVSIAYNPMANAKGATGIADAKMMLSKNIAVGLGTDGPMSSNQVDLFRVLSYASAMQRLKHNDRTIMIPKTVLRMATIGGAQALNMADKIGSLQAGKLADLIVVETLSPNMQPNYDPFATLVFQANASNVAATIINGRVVVEAKQLQTYDLEKNRQQMASIKAQIAPFAKQLAVKAKEKELSATQ
ncbi:MAG: amidohydrolase family protein [Enterovibrio sp.]